MFLANVLPSPIAAVAPVETLTSSVAILLNAFVHSQVAYPPARSTLLLRVLGCLGFVAVAGWSAAVGYAQDPARIVMSIMLIGCAGYFAFIGAAYGRALFDRASLVADEEGFSYRFLWGHRKYLWREVAELKVARYRMLDVIAFDCATAPNNWRTRRNRQVIGVSDFIIAHNFRAPLAEVCRTLNQLRQRALSVT